MSVISAVRVVMSESLAQNTKIKPWIQCHPPLIHNLINQEFLSTITDNQQETNGLENTDAMFVDGVAGDFRLQIGYSC